ncbi:MAG TPA: aquaporin [Steroidobacteraceae bacterium]|jgi:aquaporin Z|nr:aquaporin [Steroidobacteraceae bacterium]
MQQSNISIAEEEERLSSASGYGLRPTAYSLLLRHWPEYLIEGWALGTFMVSAGVFATALDYPGSPLHSAVADGNVRRTLVGIAMGLTAIALIYSPWGKRSGAHMNPAITLAFLRLKHVDRRDAAFYILAQFIGGTLGVLLVRSLLGDAFAQPPVAHVATTPTHGAVVAFVAEFAISFLMMTMVLRVSNSERYMRFTGLWAGVLVALFISLEAPYSGMSMNPARSFASALPAGMWSGLWIYFVAPVLAMQAAVALHLKLRGAASVKCSKLLHTADQRCIHCGYEP